MVVGDTLSIIFRIANRIYEQYKFVQANSRQCKQLVHRIEVCLQPLTIAENIKENRAFSVALESLKDVLTEISVCVDELSQKHFIIKFLKAASYDEMFKALNEQLSSAVSLLNLGMNMQQIFNSEQDKLDAAADMEDILKKQSLAVSQLVNQSNNELYQRMFTAISQKLEMMKMGTHLDNSFSHLEISFYNLEDLQEIGTGGYGKVCSANYRGEKVAVKMLLTSGLTTNGLKEFRREIQIASSLHSKYLIHFYGACTQAPNLALVMEFMENGNMHDFLLSDQSITWSFRIRMAEEIALGLKVLHTSKPPILHCDLKSLNVLLDAYYHCKLADFGQTIAKVETRSASINSSGAGSKGTLAWLAPELFNLRPKFTTMSDIYALGVVFWEIAARDIPYGAANSGIIADCVQKGEREEIPADCPKEFAALIKACWSHATSDRPSIDVVVQVLANLRQSYGKEQPIADSNIDVPLPAESRNNEYKVSQLSEKVQNTPFRVENKPVVKNIDFDYSGSSIGQLIKRMADNWSDEPEQERGCRALLRYAVESDDNKVAIGTEGGLDCLIQAIQTFINSTTLQVSAIGILTVLAENNLNRVCIVAKSGIEAVFKSMQVHLTVPSVQKQGFSFIHTMACNPDLEETIGEKGAITTIYQSLLYHHNANVIEVCSNGLMALCNLLYHQKHVEIFKASGGVLIVVNIVLNNISDEKIQKYGCICLWNLSADLSIRQQLYDFGVPKHIAEVLQVHANSIDVQEQAIGCLCNLSCGTLNSVILFSKENNTDKDSEAATMMTIRDLLLAVVKTLDKYTDNQFIQTKGRTVISNILELTDGKIKEDAAFIQKLLVHTTKSTSKSDSIFSSVKNMLFS